MGLFYPSKKSDVSIKIAKRICAKCPVRAKCLSFALQNSNEEGIWGGTTEEERDVMRVLLGPQLFHHLTTLAANTG